MTSRRTLRLPSARISAPVVALILALAILPVALLGASASPSATVRSFAPAALTTDTGNVCQCMPEAIYITNAAPTIGVTTGDLLNVTYQWEIPTYKPSFNGTLIHIPSMVFNFTLIKHPNIVMVLPQRNE